MEKELKLEKAYYIKECIKWQSALNDLRTENIKLKDLLSEVVSGDVSLDFVESAECFQQRFVEKDMVIDLLRHDLNVLMRKLSEPAADRPEEHHCIALEKDIKQLNREFSQMKESFLGVIEMNKKN